MDKKYRRIVPLSLLWIFCPSEHLVLRTPYCVLRNHADIIHLTIINMVTDYMQYKVRNVKIYVQKNPQ